MTYDELIRHFGSQSAAARALGIKPVSVHLWKKKGIPEPRQAQYELLTDGKLKADLPGKIVAGASGAGETEERTEA